MHCGTCEGVLFDLTHTHRAQVLELVTVSLAQHLFLIPGAQEVDTQHWAIVEEEPLKVAFKRRSRANWTAGELDLYHPTAGLEIDR